METLFLFDLGSTSIILLDTLLAGLLFQTDSLLALNFSLLDLALSLKLLRLTLDAFLFKLGGALLLSSLSGESSALSCFLLETETLSLLLFLAKTLFTFELLFAEAELLFVTLGLELLALLEFKRVELGKLLCDAGLVLLSFTLETSLLFLKGFLAFGLLLLVFESVGLVLVRKLLAASLLISLSLLPSILLFLGESDSSSFKLTHACQLLILLDLPEALFFIIGLTTGLLFGSFSLKSESLGLSKLGAAISLSLLLLLAFLFDLEPEGFFLLFLLLDDREVVIVVVVLNNAGFLAISLLIVLSIDCGVVLVFTTSALTLSFTRCKFVLLVNSTSEKITLLTAKLAHEVLLGLVTLHSNLIDGVLDLGLSIDIIFETTDHVILGEVVLAIILSDLAWGQGPGDATPWIVLFIPACAKLDHRLAPSITKLVEQVIELVVQEHVLIGLDVAQKIFHHNLTRVLVKEVVSG